MDSISKKTSNRMVTSVLLVGDSGVGKTSILNQMIYKTYNPNEVPTLGVDFKERQLDLSNNRTIRFRIWDIAGQARFDAITSRYYAQAKCILIVYNVADLETFENVPLWRRRILENFIGAVVPPIILVGNQIDCQRVVGRFEAENMAKKYGMDYFETSATTPQNCELLLEFIAERFFYHEEYQAMMQYELMKRNSSNPAENCDPRITLRSVLWNWCYCC